MMRRRRIVRLLAESGGGSSPPEERFHWELNGSDEYLQTAEATLGLANDFSVLLNVDLRGFSGEDFLFVIRSSGTSANACYVIYDGTEIKFQFRDNAANDFKLFTASIASLGLSEDSGFQVGFSLAGSVGGDPLLIYVNGSDVTASFTKSIDSTGTVADTARRITLGAFTSGSSNAEMALQDAVTFGSVVSPADFAALHAQRNDSDPLFGVSTANHHYTPQSSGAAAFSDQIGTLDLTPTNMDDTNRVQGNLVP